MSIKRCCLFILAIVWATHFLCKTVTVTDSIWALPVSMSIIHGHHTNLDEYQKLIEAKHHYAIETFNGHSYSVFPIGTPVLILPIAEVINYCCKHILYMDLQPAIIGGYDGGIELFIASFLVALTSVFVFLIVFHVSKSKYQSFLAVFVFAFCTSAWSTASRALWSHAASMLMLSIALFTLLRAFGNPKWLFLTGAALAYAYVARPTNSLSFAFLSLYVLVEYRKYILLFALGAAIVFFPFFFYNWGIYHNIISNYYLPATLNVGGNSHLKDALLANFFSPARGLFIFSPVLIFSLAGIYLLVKQHLFTKLHLTIVLIIISHYYIVSSISVPYAGWSFGPRYSCDVLPYFIFFLIYFIQYIAIMNQRALRSVLTGVFFLLMGCSFFVHYRGAAHPATFMWNANPDIDEHPERIWDWKDIQFLR